MNRNYLIAGAIIIVILAGAVALFSYQAGSDSWTIHSPTSAFVAHDEYIPVEITVSMARSDRNEDLPGMFWIILPTDEQTYLLPFVPKEVGAYANNQVDPVIFGKNGFPYGSEQRLTGYAYLSPLIFDGTYSAKFAYGHFGGEEKESPIVYSQSSDFTIKVARTFQTRKSVDVQAATGSAVTHSDTEVPLFIFYAAAAEDDVMLRAFEIGEPHSHRPPEAVKSIALFDADTGEKLSELVDLKINAQTIEGFTPFVLDTPVTVGTMPRKLEVRAIIDPNLLRPDEVNNVYFMPRLYGINTAEEKIAEQVFLSGSLKK